MSHAKELLEQATPLPWRSDSHDAVDDGAPVLGGGEAWSIDEGMVAWADAHGGVFPAEQNAALIVYAVNRLPDYEAAVEALERIGQKMADWKDATQRAGVYREADADQQMAKWVHDEAIAALRRLGGAE